MKSVNVKSTIDPLLERAQAIARATREHGGRALLVGGYVRDGLLGHIAKDADLEVYGVPAAQLRGMLSRFGRVDCVGAAYRVYKIAWHAGADRASRQRYELDVSLPRRDVKVATGHRGFEVEGDPDATIEAATRRRDFTVNAILRDPLTDEIIDPFDGQRDLALRILRAVDARHFGEDSLRVLRAMQFAARFELTVDAQTEQLCRSIDLSDLPKERIWAEWQKLLLQAPRPSLGLTIAHRLDVLVKLLPFLVPAMQREPAAVCAALDGAATEGRLTALDLAPGWQPLPTEKQLALCLGAMASFLMPAKPRDLLLDALGIHTLNGYRLRAAVMALAVDAKTASTLCQSKEPSSTVLDADLRRLAARCEPRLLYHLTRALGDPAAAAWMLQRMNALGVQDGAPTPLLMGRDLLELGLDPGPRVGQITKAIYELQLDGALRTREEALIAARALTQQ